MIILLLKGKSLNLPIYMAGYGAWRFFVEFARADDRGDTIVSFLSPSQLIAILMIVGGVALAIFEMHYEKKHASEIQADMQRKAGAKDNSDDIDTEN